MRKRVHMYSEGSKIRCEIERDTFDKLAIWIRSDDASVSLTFNAADRAKLRAALDQADAIAAAQPFTETTNE